MSVTSSYGLRWPKDTDQLKVERYMIQMGGYWKKDGKEFGLGLIHHYEAMRKILWPHLDDHRWHRICRDEIIKNKVTVLLGPGSSGKTHEAAWTYLCEYFCFPEETCVLVSSTTIQGLRMRVWGEIAMLWQQALDKFPYLPGHMLDSRIAITTDKLDDGDFEERNVRDMRKGIVGIPTVVGNKEIGLSKWVGIKQKRVRIIADEASMMSNSFLSAFANLNKNSDFRAIILGNPADPLDPLGRAAEPIDGWTTHLEPDKTSVWKTRFMNGTCVNLIGTDSPNFDFPEDQPTRYRYLISREKIADTLSFFPKDSFEYYSQCVGSMKVGILARRVITRDMCRQFHAHDPVNWMSSNNTKIAALDAAYGGDRCVLMFGEFGPDVSGKIVLSLSPPVTVPVRVTSDKIEEDQIAEFCKTACESHGVIPANFFHDSTGRGSLGTSLGRIWSTDCNPVEFGGKPTTRPVALGLYVYDQNEHQRRLKRCDEHYSKFVTELWFSVRYAIEADQMRNLPEEVMEEGCMREWKPVRDDKKELETKDDMKLRVGRSPDLFDALSIVIEGARRRGFQISKLSNDENDRNSTEFLNKYRERMNNLRKSFTLVHS